MTDTVVAEGQVKFRDGKKWKTRWVVLRKPSPVADCLSLLVYKEKKKGKEKGGGHKERLNVTLEGICGVEAGPGFEGVAYSLSVLCLMNTLVLGFSSRDAMMAWDARLRYSLGEVHRFAVTVEPGTKLESGPASLHLCNNLLTLSRGVPPLAVGHWKLSALRRYGAVPNGFVFEGGTRCGYWAGVFFLSCSEGEQISFLFDCVVRGVSPSRTPHGVRPRLPADPSTDSCSAEQRILQETSELEKRLSMLSQCSLASSTASAYSCITSVAADDRGSISSSSSSQSDASYGARLFWAAPSCGEAASGSSALKTLTASDDRLFAAVAAAGRPGSAQPQPLPRGLRASGRQSSLDSGIGIGIGIGSSSYSGSSSSCTGSLGGGEEFGSAGSLPAPPAPPAQATPPAPESLAARVSSSCSSCSSRASSHCEEYHAPSPLRLWYDTPRSVLHTPTPTPTPSLWATGGGGNVRRQAALQRSLSWGSERAPSADSDRSSTPTALLLLPQGGAASDNYITPEQWRSARSRCCFQADASSAPSTSADAHASVLHVREPSNENGAVVWTRSAPPLPPSSPPPPPSAGASHSVSPPPSAFFTPLDAVNYVNVLVGPLRAKLQELAVAEGSVSVTGAELIRGRAGGEGQRSESATPDVTVAHSSFHSLHLQ
ncbi:unnamed protein product [Ophioblennius macclurei]